MTRFLRLLNLIRLTLACGIQVPDHATTLDGLRGSPRVPWAWQRHHAGYLHLLTAPAESVIFVLVKEYQLLVKSGAARAEGVDIVSA